MKFSTIVLLILLSTCCYRYTDALAASVKKSGSKKNNGGGGGGFGAKTNVINHQVDTSPETTALVQFLKSQKSKGLADVDIGYSSTTGVRGLFCNRAFSKGKLMVQLPSDCALALSDPSKQIDDAPTLAHVGANVLSFYVKNEQAKQQWAPYLNTLPKQGSAQFDPTPDFFDDEALELLEFPRLVRQAKERRELVSALAKELDIDPDELQFATWLAASRAFRLSISSAEKGDGEEDVMYDDKGQVIAKAGEQKSLQVLVPFIDMANHSSDQPNAKLTLIDPQKDDAWFALEATRPIKAGKEILIAYGDGVQSSVELLLNYGFVPRSNKIDEFMLKKGGDECITSLDGWTTTLEEDRAMLTMTEGDAILEKILNFRVRLKESYASS